jgi:hypothetical protein
MGRLRVVGPWIHQDTYLIIYLHESRYPKHVTYNASGIPTEVTNAEILRALN